MESSLSLQSSGRLTPSPSASTPSDDTSASAWPPSANCPPPLPSWSPPPSACSSASLSCVILILQFPANFGACSRGSFRCCSATTTHRWPASPTSLQRDRGMAAGKQPLGRCSPLAHDGRGGDFKFVEGFDPGEWRLAPPHRPTKIVAKDPATWVGSVKPFLVPNVEMLRSDGPNAAYAEDFNEVKELGSLTSTKRTADQTAAAIFWQDSGPAIWNRVYRALALSHGSHGLDIVDSARLFAMTNLAAADGSIGCWNDKAYWSFWRPITAIREAASDGNHVDVAVGADDQDWCIGDLPGDEFQQQQRGRIRRVEILEDEDEGLGASRPLEEG